MDDGRGRWIRLARGRDRGATWRQRGGAWRGITGRSLVHGRSQKWSQAIHSSCTPSKAVIEHKQKMCSR